MLKKYIWKFINKLNQYIASPRMIVGFMCSDNVYLSNTRISNTTSISGINNLNIANNVFIGHFNNLDASNGLTIKEGCQITNYVSILTHSSHIAIRLYGMQYIKYNGQHLGYIKGCTSIGEYSFIGPHSLIMPGVNIGKGSLISAYSHIKSGTYPDFAILSGNPAIVIGDTREIDQEYLKQYPELIEFYNEWSKQ